MEAMIDTLLTNAVEDIIKEVCQTFHYDKEIQLDEDDQTQIWDKQRELTVKIGEAIRRYIYK